MGVGANPRLPESVEQEQSFLRSSCRMSGLGQCLPSSLGRPSAKGLPLFSPREMSLKKCSSFQAKESQGFPSFPCACWLESWDRLCFSFPEPSSQALAWLPPLPQMREARHWKRREPSTSPEPILTCLYLWEDEKQRYKETLWGSNGERWESTRGCPCIRNRNGAIQRIDRIMRQGCKQNLRRARAGSRWSSHIHSVIF